MWNSLSNDEMMKVREERYVIDPSRSYSRVGYKQSRGERSKPRFFSDQVLLVLNFAASRMLPKYNMVQVGNIAVQPQPEGGTEPRKFSKFVPKKRRSRNHLSEELIYFRQHNPADR